MYTARTRSIRISVLVPVLGLALVLSGTPRLLNADDFAFHEPGARASALGGAFTALADDASALFYNPAGLAFLGGFRLKTNFAFSDRGLTAAWPETGRLYRSEPSEFTGANSLAWQPIRRVTIGIGLFSPFNYESYWSPGWSGETVCTRNKLTTLYFRSAVAVEVVEGLALGAGVDVISSNLRWQHEIPFNIETYPQAHDIDINSAQRLHGNGLSFVAGALWKAAPAIQVGARYQKGLAIDYAGTDNFIQPLDAGFILVPRPEGGSWRVSQLIDFYYKDQDVTGRLTLPDELVVGVLLTPFARLSLCLDVQWDRWSGFGDWIFRSVNEGPALNPDFTSVYQEFYGLELDYGTQGVVLGLRDTTAVKAGLEFRPAPYLALRAGYAHTRGSAEESELTPVYPDLDRNVLSLGFGYDGPLFSIWGDERVSDLSFDLFLRYAAAASGTSAYPGFEMTYDSNRLVFGVGAGLSF